MIDHALSEYRDKCDRSYSLELAGAEQEIRDAFALIGKVPMARIAVPFVTVRASGRVQIAAEPMDSAVFECLEYPNPKLALLAVLENSQCPHVAALREAMCRQWVDAHAGDIAEARI